MAVTDLQCVVLLLQPSRLSSGHYSSPLPGPVASTLPPEPALPESSFIYLLIYLFVWEQPTHFLTELYIFKVYTIIEYMYAL